MNPCQHPVPPYPTRPRSRTWSRCALWPTTLGLLAALGACVDPQGRYDDFLGRTDALRGGASDAGVSDGERFDFSGRYLAALATGVAMDKPLLFECQVVVARDLTSFDITLQPLGHDASNAPRTPVGDPIVVPDVPFEADGRFAIPLGQVDIPGAANAISGSDIAANVTLEGSAHPAEGSAPMGFCGGASGMVTAPIALDLAGSSFAAVHAPEGTPLTDVTRQTGCP